MTLMTLMTLMIGNFLLCWCSWLLAEKIIPQVKDGALGWSDFAIFEIGHIAADQASFKEFIS